MKENVGGIDRKIRFVIGPTLMGIGIAQLRDRRRGSLGGILSLLAGEALLNSAVTRVCPANALLGIDTSEHGHERRSRRRTRADEEAYSDATAR